MSNLVRSPKFPYLSVFLVGVVLRGIPELLVSWYPIGYETIAYYAPSMMTFPERSLVDVFSSTFRAGPLFYAIMWLVCVVSQAHPYLILKVTGPVLYGCFAVSFFLFLKKGLNLDVKMAFVAALICIFSPVALRLSWDRFRNVLGSAFLFVTLTMLMSSYKFKWPITAFLAVITALARDIIAIVMFATVIGYAFLRRKDRGVSFLAFAPAFTVFLLVRAFSFYLWNYTSDEPVAWSYAELLANVFLLFTMCYLHLLPLVIKGFQRSKLLDPMLACLLIGSFSLLIVPWISIPGYDRWQMMLIFPFSIYAVQGLGRLHLFSKDRRKVLIAILMVFMTIGVGYSTGAFSYMHAPYIPVNLLQSSIDLNQTNDVIDCLQWVNNTAPSNSCIIAEERFIGWTLIYLKRANKDITVIVYVAEAPPQLGLNEALQRGFSQIYLIWYTNSTIEEFRRLYTQDGISIFQYG